MEKKHWLNGLILLSIFILFASYLFGSNVFKKVPGKEPEVIKISDTLAVKVDDEKGKFTWNGAIEQCASYGKGWHSPTMIELLLLYEKRKEIAGFNGEWYWSSSDFFNDFGRSLNFKTGEQNDDYESKDHANCVRCVKTLEKK